MIKYSDTKKLSDGLKIRSLNNKDREWLNTVIEQYWGSTKIVTRGKIHDTNELAGLVAIQEDKPVGGLTYSIEDNQCEIVTLNSMFPNTGIGASLLKAAKDIAVQAQCQRLWLITTNDNLAALGFYQKRGFRLVAIHRNALEESRKLKPEIPRIGLERITLLDEIELEMLLK